MSVGRGCAPVGAFGFGGRARLRGQMIGGHGSLCRRTRRLARRCGGAGGKRVRHERKAARSMRACSRVVWSGAVRDCARAPRPRPTVGQ